jgi:hypothetical protein
MPLKSGTSQKTVGKNIREFMKGDTYAATRRKFGKVTADKQAIAAALEKQRDSQSKK